MDNPTHADAFMNLISSCFPSSCRPNAPALPPSPRLGALLRDTESDDAMSLHSTYRPHTRQKKKKPAMQLCGINLFGKPRGQIRLEDDDDLEPPMPRPRPRYDSDAAPLPDSTIQSLSVRSPTTPTTTEQPTKQASPEEELARLRAEKAARKARKRERKLKRQLALEHTAEFEGFIGSGGGDGFPISPPSTTTSTPGIEDLLDGSERGSSRLIDDADPEDGEADMGAGVYTRSTRSRSESGSSATRSSRAREEGLGVNALGLGLRGPPSPLAQVPIPEDRNESESVIKSTAEPEIAKSQVEADLFVAQTEPTTPTKVEPPVQAQPEPDQLKTPTSPTRQRPRIHISDLPLSSPGAGPGPRTLENSPRLQSLQESSLQDGYGFPSPHLSVPSPRHTNLPTPRIGLASPSGFPSSGLSRRGFPSPGLGKSLGLPSGAGGLNSFSARGSGGGAAFGDSGSRVLVAGGGKQDERDGDVLESGGGRDRDRDGNGDGDRDGRSGDASPQGRRGASDGSWADGDVPGQLERDGQGSDGSGQAHRWKGDAGRVTAGMGVALANRGE
ncbi:hypothetical protein RHS03_10021, partial [Rhizoctonia solani]